MDSLLRTNGQIFATAVGYAARDDDSPSIDKAAAVSAHDLHGRRWYAVVDRV